MTQAARRCRVSARTVHRWVATGEVESCLTGEGYRRIKAATLPAPIAVSEGVSDGVTDGSDSVAEPVAATPGGFTRPVAEPVADVSESPSRNGASHEVSPGAAILAATERERDQAKAEVEFLRDQLALRAEEFARRDQAEAELRRVLALLEQTNRELSAALVQKALPPAPEVIAAAPRRVRWWWPFKR